MEPALWLEKTVFQITYTTGYAVLGLSVLVVSQKALRNLIADHRRARERYFQGRLMRYLNQYAPDDALLAPKKPGDSAILRDMLVRAAETLKGAVAQRIIQAFRQLGFVERELRRLRSRRWWIRAEASYHLGLMTAVEAKEPLRRALREKVYEAWFMAARSYAFLAGEEALPEILRTFTDCSRWASLEVSEIFL